MYIKENIWHLHSFSTDRCFLMLAKFECQKDIHFKTQPGAMQLQGLRAGNLTRDPESLEQRSAD